MAVTIVKSNQTVPTISNDAYPGTDTYLFSVLQGTAFSIDVAFTLDDGAEPPVNVPITSVVPSLSGGYTSVSFTTVDTNPLAYKIRVAGTLTNVLPRAISLPTGPDPTASTRLAAPALVSLTIHSYLAASPAAFCTNALASTWPCRWSPTSCGRC